MSQVYNLCLHSVWSLHPSDVCKVMTFSTHALSIKLLPLHARTHRHTPTSAIYHYNAVISGLSDTGVTIKLSLDVLPWQVSVVSGRCTLVSIIRLQKGRNHIKDASMNLRCFLFLGWLYIYLSKKGGDSR